ncbi:hypothetical protein ACWATR_35405 [Nostoc sp. UIC 10890]
MVLTKFFLILQCIQSSAFSVIFSVAGEGTDKNRIIDLLQEKGSDTEMATDNEPSDSHQKKEIKALLASKADLNWSNLFWEQIKTTITRIEEGAKQIISIATFSQTIYFAAISFTTVKQGLHLLPPFQQRLFILLFLLPLICWCASLLGATLVLIPRHFPKYKAHPDYPDQVERRFWVIVNYKFYWLKIAQIILWVGFFLLIVSAFIYFAFIPLPPTPATNSL